MLLCLFYVVLGGFTSAFWFLHTFETAGEPIFHAHFGGENMLELCSVRGFASSFKIGEGPHTAGEVWQE